MRTDGMQFNGLIYNIIQKSYSIDIKQKNRMDVFRKEYGQTLSFVRTKKLFYMDED
jgi:hypothetical protein